jgi:hypothetical protein
MDDDRNTFAIHGLKRKRCELAGQLLVLQEQMRVVRLDLTAVDRALKLLDPDAAPRKIKPLRATKRCKYFDAGEMARMLLDEMRQLEGKPASIPRLTASVMEAKGLDPTHIDAFRAIQHRITMQLAKLAKRGTVRKIGQRVAVAWALPTE